MSRSPFPCGAGVRALPLVAALACGGGPTPPPRAPRLGLGYEARGAYADPVIFHAEIRQGGRRRVIRGADLVPREAGPGRVAGGVESVTLRADEPVSVRVALVLAPGDTAAAGDVAWTPEAGVGYGVGAVAGAARPVAFCAWVAHAIPLPPRAGGGGDTLFVVRSALPDGAVC